jgi:general secretion pathway protein N
VRPGSLAILGIAAYSAFLVATVPARWLQARLLPAAPGRYEVSAVDGSLWNGNAQAVVNAPGGTLVVDRIQWTFLPARLLQGRLAFATELKGAGFEAKYEAGRSLAGWALRDLTVRADAALATAALPWIDRWRPEGSVTASSPGIDVAGEDVHGDLRIEWKGAATALSEVRPLGSYRADVLAEGKAARVSLSTLEGALRLTGHGRLEFPTRFTLTGEARGEGPAASTLNPLLDMFGPPRADGARAIQWQVR